MGGKLKRTARSNRSPRVATSSMLVRMTGRVAEKIASSPSVKSSRVAKPDPVDRQQIASESQAGMVDKLSKANTQLLLAAIIKSRTSFGSDRNGAVLGSTKDRIILATVDFDDPCCP